MIPTNLIIKIIIHTDKYTIILCRCLNQSIKGALDAIYPIHMLPLYRGYKRRYDPFDLCLHEFIKRCRILKIY